MDGILAIILCIFIFALYFLPAIVAGNRNHPNQMPITIINLFLGWTLLGWVISLAWACMDISDKVNRIERSNSIKQNNHDEGSSNLNLPLPPPLPEKPHYNKKDILDVIPVLLLLGAIIYGCIKESGETSADQSIKSGYTLTDKESIILDIMIKNDNVFGLCGGYALLYPDYKFVSARGVAEEYAENEVAADQKYYKAPLFVIGRVSSVNSVLRNEPYIVLSGPNQFSLPQARFKSGSRERIINLKKGQYVHLVCKGGGAVSGAPIFKNCEFVQYHAKQISTIKTDVFDFLSGKAPGSNYIHRFTVSAISAARDMPETSVCYSNNQIDTNQTNAEKSSACHREIEMSCENREQARWTEVVNDLKAAGL